MIRAAASMSRIIRNGFGFFSSLNWALLVLCSFHCCSFTPSNNKICMDIFFYMFLYNISSLLVGREASQRRRRQPTNRRMGFSNSNLAFINEKSCCWVSFALSAVSRRLVCNLTVNFSTKPQFTLFFSHTTAKFDLDWWWGAQHEQK